MIGVPTLANKLYFKEGVRVRSARHAGSAIFRFPRATHGRGQLSRTLSSPLPPDRRSRLAAGLFLKLNTQHPENKNMSRWFGHALATCSAAQILASGDSQPSKARKAVLLASAGQYLTAPLNMLSQKEFKPEMVALNTVTCGVVGALCLKAALKE